MAINQAGIRLPFVIPFSLTINEEGTIIVSEEAGLSLPFVIPFSLTTINKTSETTTRESGFSIPFSLPFGCTTETTTSGGSTKQTITKYSKYRITEEAWDFTGIIFDEYIVGQMKSQLLLIEEIKSRILVNVILLDRNNIRLEWYGGNVPAVNVFKKLSIDETYKLDNNEPVPWEEGGVNVAISDDSYDIILKSPNGEGESGSIALGETFYMQVKSLLGIALNRKIHYINIDMKSKFNIKVNV